MARVKGAVTTRARHKKVLKRAKGYFGAKSIRFRMANQAVMKSGNYAYVGRKQKKRNFRQRLGEMAANDMTGFKALVEKVQK